MDYLSLGVFDGFRIGVKPLYHKSKDSHAMGFRLRVEWDDSEASILDLKSAVKVRFPKVPFSKYQPKYCSLVGAVPMENVFDHQSAMMWLDNVNYLASTVQTIVHILQIDLGDNRSVIEEFFDKAYRLLIDVVNSDSHTQNPVQSKNNVVQLKPKDKGNDG